MKKRPCNDFKRSISDLHIRNVDKFALRTAQFSSYMSSPDIPARSGATQEVEKAGSSVAKRKARNTCHKRHLNRYRA